jgi:hypothetical protein
VDTLAVVPTEASAARALGARDASRSRMGMETSSEVDLPLHTEHD